MNQDVHTRQAMCDRTTGVFNSTYYVMPCQASNDTAWTLVIVQDGAGGGGGRSREIIIVNEVMACFQKFFGKYKMYPIIYTGASSSSVQVFSGYGAHMYKIMAKGRQDRARGLIKEDWYTQGVVEDLEELMALLTR